MAKKKKRGPRPAVSDVAPACRSQAPPGEVLLNANDSPAEIHAIPNPIEIACYELGIRLTQCRELLCRAQAGQFHPIRRAAGGDDLIALRSGLRQLEAALRDLAAGAQSDADVAEMGLAIVGDLVRLWADWQELPRWQLADDGFNDRPFPEGLERLEHHVANMLRRNPNGAERAEMWLRLGAATHEGDWTEKSPGRPPRHARDGWVEAEYIWARNNDVQFHRMLDELSVPESRLCPEFDDAMYRLLPYSDQLPAMWFQVEAGLQQLKQEVRQAFSQGDQPKTVSTLPIIDDRPVEKQEEPRLSVDINEKYAKLDGRLFRLESEAAAIFLQALIDAEGAWLSGREISIKYPQFLSARVDRVRSGLPAPIRALIETQSPKGSRIPTERLRRQ